MREVHYSAFLDFVIVLEKHLTIGFINNYITGQSLRGKKWKELICLSQIPICQVFILWEIISSAILVVHIWINHKISHIASLQRSFKVCIYKQIHTFIDTYVCVCVYAYFYIFCIWLLYHTSSLVPLASTWISEPTILNSKNWLLLSR